MRSEEHMVTEYVWLPWNELVSGNVVKDWVTGEDAIVYRPSANSNQPAMFLFGAGTATMRAEARYSMPFRPVQVRPITQAEAIMTLSEHFTIEGVWECPRENPSSRVPRLPGERRA